MDIIRFCVMNKVKNHGDIFSILCPFHEEITPSMAINISNGSYHCFGCQANGQADEIQMMAELVRIKGKVASKIMCKQKKEP